jgi:Protein of unknown function (DUF541)
MTTRSPFVFLATAAVGLAAALALGAGTVFAQDPAPAETVAAAFSPSLISVAPTLPPTPQPGGTGGGVATRSAIVSPYSGVSPAVAPEHTIVVTGTGYAGLAVDGSDRAAAERSAIAAALADAKVQADAIARGTGLTITGVLSVSASVSPYGPVPLGIEVPAPGSTTNGSTPAQPPTIAQESLTVSVTVAYRVR